jgi:Tfp pilus assembly protein PilF
MTSSRRIASLGVVLAVSLVAGCKHVPTEREKQGSQAHYDLGVQAQRAGDVQAAYKEYERALELDESFADAHNAIAILYHLSFKKVPEAIKHYERALELRPDFSEAKTNLGNLYLDEKRYDEAIKLYRDALNDMLYPTPFIAQGNLGWALYKKGDARGAIDAIKAAVTTNPKFCLGYRNLGIIHDEQGDTETACRDYRRYKESCPDVADAYYREGVCLAKAGKHDEAKASFQGCTEKATAEDLKDDCRKLSEQLRADH